MPIDRADLAPLTRCVAEDLTLRRHEIIGERSQSHTPRSRAAAAVHPARIRPIPVAAAQILGSPVPPRDDTQFDKATRERARAVERMRQTQAAPQAELDLGEATTAVSHEEPQIEDKMGVPRIQARVLRDSALARRQAGLHYRHSGCHHGQCCACTRVCVAASALRSRSPKARARLVSLAPSGGDQSWPHVLASPRHWHSVATTPVALRRPT